ncbi:MAG: hypothetical protein IJM17_02895 [Firmicutes bacterium]|nr:hypothetical protein [Bacillota bacterium]
MFFTERFVSLSVYAAVLFAACWLMKYAKKDQYRGVLACYLAVLCVFAFMYKPYVTSDLYRLRTYIAYWINKPFKDAVKYALRHSNQAWTMYAYFVSKLPGENWLQTVSCFWTFGNLFYIVGGVIKASGLKREDRSLTLFWLMSVGAIFLHAVSGIRTMLGFSLVAFCFYRETMEGKSVIRHLPLYAVAALFHSASAVLVVSRLLFMLIESDSFKKTLFVACVVALGAGGTALFLRRNFRTVIKSARLYLIGGEYTYYWEIIIGLLEIARIILVLYEYRKMAGGLRRKDGRAAAWKFTAIWTAVSLAALPFSYAVFRRYTMLCTVTGLPIMGMTLEKEREAGGGNRFAGALWAISLVIAAISLVRGDICGYKFFVLGS